MPQICTGILPLTRFLTVLCMFPILIFVLTEQRELFRTMRDNSDFHVWIFFVEILGVGLNFWQCPR